MCFFLKTKHLLEVELDDDSSSETNISIAYSRRSSTPRELTPEKLHFTVEKMPTFVPSALIPPVASRPEEQTLVYPYYVPAAAPVAVPAPTITYTPTITYGLSSSPPKPNNAELAQKIADTLVQTSSSAITTTHRPYTTSHPATPTSRDFEKATKEYLQAELELKKKEQEWEEDRSRSLLQVTRTERRTRSVSVSTGRGTRVLIEHEPVRRCRYCDSSRHRTRDCDRTVSPHGTLVVLPAVSQPTHRRSRSVVGYREPTRRYMYLE